MSHSFDVFSHSRHADFELPFDLLTRGVERLAGILEDVLDSAVGVIEVLSLPH